MLYQTCPINACSIIYIDIRIVRTQSDAVVCLCEKLIMWALTVGHSSKRFHWVQRQQFCSGTWMYAHLCLKRKLLSDAMVFEFPQYRTVKERGVSRALETYTTSLFEPRLEKPYLKLYANNPCPFVSSLREATPARNWEKVLPQDNGIVRPTVQL